MPYRDRMRTRNLFKPGAAKPFNLSRTRVENFLNCPRCFYIDRKLGVEPPSGFEVSGAIDDVWKERGTGKLIVADY